ncbi:Aste57867_12090 [Aphanomyces stellatus]|uniref:Aste57867_12090 protein n=1 Tax=Aphanomyces stellatus TaxID=120398 RepID=A0A485KUM1_9STRA|nr:hypothetical protein As57867_012045 [Aphanomyces stellatus]VFT88945.1 Aste57867_12090 [Aphanomyces stellatus]
MRIIKIPCTISGWITWHDIPKARALLIRQGDMGDRCYILIDGLVDVYAKDDMLSSTGVDENASDNQYSVVKPTTDYGEYKATLGPGTVVGDVVLLNPSARRNATVIVSKLTQECFLIVLGRTDYVRLIRTVSMETSHYIQAEVLDFMFLFQRWPTADKMKIVAQMRSTNFRANDYLYRAGTVAKMMYILVSGEAMEKHNLNMIANPRSSTKQKSEIKINVELMLIGPGEIANELPFLKASLTGAFDIKAVTDVHALGITVCRWIPNGFDERLVSRKHLFDTIVASDKDYVQDMQAKLVSMANDREDWRKERLEFASRYPDAHVAMTWNLMRMGNLRCSRCGRRGHLAHDIARCHHTKRYEWLPLLARIEKQLGQTNAVILKMQRATSAVVAMDNLLLHPKKRSVRSLFPYNTYDPVSDNEALLAGGKEQLADCWRQRLLVFPKLTLQTVDAMRPRQPVDDTIGPPATRDDSILDEDDDDDDLDDDDAFSTTSIES